MKVYEISMVFYNHVSGQDSDVIDTKFKDLNTAKRKLLELVSQDDNLWENDDAVCNISKDFMSARTEGGRDWCDYLISEADVKISEKKSPEFSDEDIDQWIEELSNINEHIDFNFE